MKPVNHTLYCVADGADLHGVASLIEARFRELASESGWRWRRPEVVNRRQDDSSSLREGDLPLWELGVVLALPDPGCEPSGWFLDVERVAQFAGRVCAETGREFVIGIRDAKRGISEDLFDIDAGSPDIEALKAIIGVSDAV